MTEAIVDEACKRIRQRGGNTVLNRGSATRQILSELVLLTEPSKNRTVKSMQGAAKRRRAAAGRADDIETRRQPVDHLVDQRRVGAVQELGDVRPALGQFVSGSRIEHGYAPINAVRFERRRGEPTRPALLRVQFLRSGT